MKKRDCCLMISMLGTNIEEGRHKVWDWPWYGNMLEDIGVATEEMRKKEGGYYRPVTPFSLATFRDKHFPVTVIPDTDEPWPDGKIRY